MSSCVPHSFVLIRRTIIQVPYRTVILVFQPARTNPTTLVYRVDFSAQFVIQDFEILLCYWSTVSPELWRERKEKDMLECTIAIEEVGVWIFIIEGSADMVVQRERQRAPNILQIGQPKYKKEITK